jgi:acyl-CoA hydrolase
MNDTVLLSADVTWTGRTSMEVRVETFVEHLSGLRQLVNRAYLVFVAVDTMGDPRLIPPLLPQTEKAQKEWQQAEIRRAHRLGQRHTGEPKATGDADDPK